MFLRAATIITLLIAFTSLNAQDKSPAPTTVEEAEARYAKNIKKGRINGVYIPKDHLEAIKELKEISPDEALDKFRMQSEEMVIKKLHFGLGRWIRYNWNFYEGSRLGEQLRGLGISHPDDMSTFLMTLLHRELNGNPYDEKALIAELSKARKKKNGMNREVNTIKTTKATKAPDNGGK